MRHYTRGIRRGKESEEEKEEKEEEEEDDEKGKGPSDRPAARCLDKLRPAGRIGKRRIGLFCAYTYEQGREGVGKGTEEVTVALINGT
ncbi:hypothetical protein E2C01_083092 [Portunus trituberculatus]|uniref:Uncharacterized protein n=1 Tax=Portunus trituberculatus TaxID=210409 RepID=A0A5B7J080_PORTR|nr:hypothetical protein [Portunus trituberculatus]